ncbi:MAG: WD40-repeat-containing domain protein [Benniella sp.]|nr:MAG: WD40-repeat-containing domain protein [Benniella sp.]
MVASASEDNSVRLWDVATGDRRRTLTGHTEGAMGVAYAPYGVQIVTCSKDHTVRLWDAGTGECCKVLEGHTNWVREVVYSPQGDQLASAGDDTIIRLWNVKTGECQMTLTGHTHWIMSITYSTDGKLLASGSWGKTVRLWKVSTGKCRTRVRNFQSAIRCVAWCATFDADYLITGCEDGSVLQWQVMAEDDQCRVRLRWSAANGALTVTGASIQGARGLTALNKQLLKQRGAVGERRAKQKVVHRGIKGL